MQQEIVIGIAILAFALTLIIYLTIWDTFIITRIARKKYESIRHFMKDAQKDGKNAK